MRTPTSLYQKLHATIGCLFLFAYGIAQNIPTSVDFDGVDDYISRPAFLGDHENASMMSWVKFDNQFDGGTVLGQKNYNLFIDSNNRLKVFIRTNGEAGSTNSIVTPDDEAPQLNINQWYHVATTYNGSNGELRLYLNGNLEYVYGSLSGVAITNDPEWNSVHDFEIGRNTEFDNDYFEGDIYETRVYNVALDQKQLHQQVCQEIQEYEGMVRGTVIPKTIDGLNWEDLELYYKMDSVINGFTIDYSQSKIDGGLFNMTTSLVRTAPMPYITKSSPSNSWSDKDNWLHGDVWDITDNYPDCAIIIIRNDIKTNLDQNMLGLIVESGSKLEVTNDNGIFNSWYLKLDGKIDLEGESQLIQSANSELDVTSTGIIERDQQGTADNYTYNYWSSPVGINNITTNNNGYTLPDVMFDGIQSINFLTSGYDGANTSPISIADYWIWKFANLLDSDYSAWQHVRSTGNMLAGEGFTMKGPGSGGIFDDQNYVFKGKPNNGDINLTIHEGNDYLVGNPYASALDAKQFLLDNSPEMSDEGATTGTLYFWKHWGGGSHNFTEYRGGYAIYNLSGGTPAASKGTNDANLETGGIPTKVPGRFIPVSQGFFVIGQTDGIINFNNGQRVFQKEGINSVFMEANNPNSGIVPGRSASSDGENNGDPRMKVRIGLNSINEIHRQLLVTVDENSTPGFDWGYDGVLYEYQVDDLYWMIDGEKYIIQGTNAITETTILPIGIHTDDDGMNSIMIDKLENVADHVEIYLHDKELDIYHDLRAGEYQIYLIAGSYLERFEITFSNQEVLDIEDAELDVLDVHYDNAMESIIVMNPTNRVIDAIELFNILGQSVFVTTAVDHNDYSEFKVSNLSTGTYIIKVKTPQGSFSKKVLVK